LFLVRDPDVAANAAARRAIGDVAGQWAPSRSMYPSNLRAPPVSPYVGIAAPAGGGLLSRYLDEDQ
jgi:hypothetical protein